MFINYTELEIFLFNRIKEFFETLPPTATDDYPNGFFDIVAQYGGGGQSYILLGDEFDSIVTAQLEIEINKLTPFGKKELVVFYESNFLLNYLNDEGDGYIYSDEEFVLEVASRFRAWIDDNFSLDEMLEALEEEDQIEFNEDESDEKIEFIKKVIENLLRKNYSDIKKRKLQLALIYIAYHPLVPDQDFVISISFKSLNIFYEIEYSYEAIKLAEYYTEDGSCWYNYKFEITESNRYEELGEFLSYASNVNEIINSKSAQQIVIASEYI